MTRGNHGKRARLVLVEDQPEAIQAIETLFRSSERYLLERIFTELETAIQEIPGIAPDAVLMDIVFPGASGIDVLQKLRDSAPETRFVMLTAFPDPDYIFAALMAGADGYILKSDPPEQIMEKLEELLRGGVAISRPIARRVLQFFQKLGQRVPAAADELSTLSRRETEILDLLSKGFVAKEAAVELGISAETVRTHLKRIYKKLHVNSGRGAIAKYLHGQTSLPKLLP